MFGLLLLTVWAGFAASQTCFWPNGDTVTPSANGIPCTSGNSGQHLGSSASSSTCCPPGQTCLSNGLCQNPNDSANQLGVGTGSYGMYGCTDDSFDGCLSPSICSDEPLGGAEAIVQCADNVWCCNRNNEVGNCCDGDIPNSPMFFALNGLQATPTTLPGSSSSGSAGGSGGSTSISSDSVSIPASSSTPTSSPVSAQNGGGSSTTTTRTTTSSGHVLVSTVTVGPTSGADSGSSSSNSSNTGLIVGCAVGIPLGVILLAIVGFLLWRRRRKQKRERATVPKPNTDPDKGDGLFTSPYMNKEGTAWNPSEADSLPIKRTKPATGSSPLAGGAAELSADGPRSSTIGSSGSPISDATASAQNTPNPMYELPGDTQFSRTAGGTQA